MANVFDNIVKDDEGYIRIEDENGVVLFRIIDNPLDKIVHIRLRKNCRQVTKRGSPDYYVKWTAFKRIIEQDQNSSSESSS